ncbi:MAG: hypothetical protein Q8P18_11445 [Pseudomonadota bacterium]|nr:hypothetical protein [Pseudomonadota bacterium]
MPLLSQLLPLLAACTSTADDTAAEQGWAVVGEGLDSALLSIWGTAWNDVWVVGADSGSGGVLLHFDGAAWARVGDLGPGDAWAIEGTDTTLWISGAGGRLFRYDLASGQLSTDQLDSALVFFGVWPASPTDAWAVGGSPDDSADPAVIYHFDGTAWTDIGIASEPTAEATFFKVSGTAADDVWVVGDAGNARHYDGSSWSTVPTGITANLFGIRGRYAVGGSFNGAILAWNGSAFIEETPLYSYQFTGISDDGVHTPTAVGTQGQVFLRGDAGWDPDPAEAVTLQDLHAVWIDPEGGTWAVGGHLSSPPLIHGVVIYKGARTIAPLEAL